jgi:NRAMP (natural resistance-associated macrophage protein)-like metal ion transporter
MAMSTRASGPDEMERHPLVHPRSRRRGRLGILRHLGPGLVTGAADDDPSGIGTYSQLGAQFGLGMLWTVPLSLPLAAAVEELAGRLGLAGGEGLASLIKKNFPRPVLYVAALLVTGANTFNIGADLGSMVASLQLVIRIPFLPFLITITSVMLVLEVFVQYHQYARFLRFLTLSLFAYIGVLAVVHVDWSAVAINLVIPHVAAKKEYLAGLVAIFGTTISPYLMFWQCSAETEETADRKGRPRRVTHREILGMRVDVIAGMAAAVVIMFAILVVAASTLGAHGVTNIGTADQAARALKPLAGDFAGLLFALGIVGTGALAVPVLAGSTGYALAEAFAWHEGLSKSFLEARGFYLVIIGSMFVGLAMNTLGLNPIKALVYSALLNGLVSPPLILLMLILGNKQRAVHRYRSGWVSNALVGFACLLMTVLPLVYLLVK